MTHKKYFYPVKVTQQDINKGFLAFYSTNNTPQWAVKASHGSLWLVKLNSCNPGTLLYDVSNVSETGIIAGLQTGTYKDYAATPHGKPTLSKTLSLARFQREQDTKMLEQSRTLVSRTLSSAAGNLIDYLKSQWHTSTPSKQNAIINKKITELNSLGYSIDLYGYICLKDSSKALTEKSFNISTMPKEPPPKPAKPKNIAPRKKKPAYVPLHQFQLDLA